MKKFDIPTYYRSPLIGAIKESRKLQDPRKRDFNPTLLQVGDVTFVLPRHFGFCYGVENAIEVSYKAITENPGKPLYLLSEMIHNPAVNDDLQRLGIRFILNTEGEQLIPWETIQAGDVVITPAFGTTVEIAKMLQDKGVETATYNTTCPFVL
jgi:4-hydroxy-3-methylbut-2-enyl diphosphate reductase